MGLISKEVEILLSSKNIKYYEYLGYEIPRYYNKRKKTMCVKRGAKIKVIVKDLPISSHIKVKVKCDYCGKEYEIKYQNYTRHNHDGKNYCKICSSTVLTSKENNGMFGICRYGKDNPNYNPNKTDEEREQGRNYPEYTEFIKKVLKRDNYTCQCCGKKPHGKIEVHHLNSYDWCKQKRTDETNGITLCKSCHKNFHSIYGYGNNTKEQFEEWIGKAIKLLEYDGELPTARKIYCIEEDKIYDNALELAKEWNVNFANVYSVCNHKKHKNGSYCKSIKDKHLLWLDEYEKYSEKDIKKYLEWCNTNNHYKKVICITTNKIFDSVKQASKFYNIKSYSHISRCCAGKLKSCGKLEDGTPLRWMYYKDYLKQQ